MSKKYFSNDCFIKPTETYIRKNFGNSNFIIFIHIYVKDKFRCIGLILKLFKHSPNTH